MKTFLKVASCALLTLSLQTHAVSNNGPQGFINACSNVVPGNVTYQSSINALAPYGVSPSVCLQKDSVTGKTAPQAVAEIMDFINGVNQYTGKANFDQATGTFTDGQAPYFISYVGNFSNLFGANANIFPLVNGETYYDIAEKQVQDALNAGYTQTRNASNAAAILEQVTPSPSRGKPTATALAQQINEDLKDGIDYLNSLQTTPVESTDPYRYHPGQLDRYIKKTFTRRLQNLLGAQKKMSFALETMGSLTGAKLDAEALDPMKNPNGYLEAEGEIKTLINAMWTEIGKVKDTLVETAGSIRLEKDTLNDMAQELIAQLQTSGSEAQNTSTPNAAIMTYNNDTLRSFIDVSPIKTSDHSPFSTLSNNMTSILIMLQNIASAAGITDVNGTRYPAITALPLVVDPVRQKITLLQDKIIQRLQAGGSAQPNEDGAKALAILGEIQDVLTPVRGPLQTTKKTPLVLSTLAAQAIQDVNTILEDTAKQYAEDSFRLGDGPLQQRTQDLINFLEENLKDVEEALKDAESKAPASAPSTDAPLDVLKVLASNSDLSKFEQKHLILYDLHVNSINEAAINKLLLDNPGQASKSMALRNLGNAFKSAVNALGQTMEQLNLLEPTDKYGDFADLTSKVLGEIITLQQAQGSAQTGATEQDFAKQLITIIDHKRIIEPLHLGYARKIKPFGAPGSFNTNMIRDLFRNSVEYVALVNSKLLEDTTPDFDTFGQMVTAVMTQIDTLKTAAQSAAALQAEVTRLQAAQPGTGSQASGTGPTLESKVIASISPYIRVLADDSVKARSLAEAAGDVLAALTKDASGQTIEDIPANKATDLVAAIARNLEGPNEATIKGLQEKVTALTAQLAAQPGTGSQSAGTNNELEAEVLEKFGPYIILPSGNKSAKASALVNAASLTLMDLTQDGNISTLPSRSGPGLALVIKRNIEASNKATIEGLQDKVATLTAQLAAQPGTGGQSADVDTVLEKEVLKKLTPYFNLSIYNDSAEARTLVNAASNTLQGLTKDSKGTLLLGVPATSGANLATAIKNSFEASNMATIETLKAENARLKAAATGTSGQASNVTVIAGLNAQLDSLAKKKAAAVSAHNATVQELSNSFNAAALSGKEKMIIIFNLLPIIRAINAESESLGLGTDMITLTSKTSGEWKIPTPIDPTKIPTDLGSSITPIVAAPAPAPSALHDNDVD